MLENLLNSNKISRDEDLVAIRNPFTKTYHILINRYGEENLIINEEMFSEMIRKYKSPIIITKI